MSSALWSDPEPAIRNQAKSKGPRGRKEQADGNKVGWDAVVRDAKRRKNESVQKG